MNKMLLLWALFASWLQPALTQPVIHSFSPLSGAVGTTAIIYGENFDGAPGNNIVYFGAVKAVVTAATNTSLTVTVPAGATFKPVTVTTGGLTAYSKLSFITTFAGGGHILPGSFAPRFDISSFYVQTSTLADLDTDGLSDVLAAEGGGVAIYRNTSTNGAISFAPNVNYATRPGLTGMATGDLDGDGKLDIAVTAYAPGVSGVSVFRNTSTPGVIALGSRIDYPSGGSLNSYAEDVAIGDLDGDGKPDMAVRNANLNMSVFRNTSSGVGNISMGFMKNFPIGGGTGNISFSDLDNDGKLDVIVSGGNNSWITVFRNTSTRGNIEFTPTSVSAGLGPIFAAAGDLDNDGKNDLVVVGNSQQVTIFKNTSTVGNITFQLPPIKYPVQWIPTGVAITDMDGDGKADLVVAEAGHSQVYVFRNNNNNSDISFDLPVVYTGNQVTYSIIAGDIDQDGAPEMLTCGLGQGKMAVFRNLVKYPYILNVTPTYGGPGTTVTIRGYNFTNSTAVNFGPTAANSFTVLSDTVIEAVVGSGPTGIISVTGPVGTDTGPYFSDLSGPVISSFAPIDGDTGTQVTLYGSNFDVVPDNNIVYFGDVKGVVSSVTTSSISVKVPPGATYKPITVTCRGLTASTAHQFTPTFKGAPAAFLATSLAAKKDFAMAAGTQFVYTADIDGDGKTDVITSSWSSSLISLFHNTSSYGHITLSSRIDILTGIYPGRLVTADMNGDGKFELLYASEEFNTVVVLRNSSTPGSPGFAPKIDLPVESVSDLAVADVDGDGLPDLVAVSALTKGAFSVFQNASSDDNIMFNSPIYFPAGISPRHIALADLNQDGKPEAILANGGNDSIYVYPNTSDYGKVSFASPLIYNTGDYPSAGLLVGDVNKDSLPDLLTWNYTDSSVSILKNSTASGNIQFDPFITIKLTMKARDLKLGDLDGDTKPDIATGSLDVLALLRNNAANNQISYLPGVNYALGNGSNAGIAASDLDNDGKPELIVVNGSPNAISVFRNKLNEPLVLPSDNIISRVTIDSVIQTYMGFPYVQRHYDIGPDSSSSPATATVTLYFSQQEFDNYNAFPAHGADLPYHPADNINKANLRISQFHGSSPSGLPGTYSGAGVVIDPDDDKIIWNETAQWWEVTFDVVGFSGFFAGSAGNTIVPLQLVSFTARREGNQALIEWKTSQEDNLSHFTLQRSPDGLLFSPIAQIPATNLSIGSTYRYFDNLGTDPVYYYRLQIVDNDNSVEYSKWVSVKTGYPNITLTIAPNPASSMALVKYPAAATGDQLLLVDVGGRVVKKLSLAAGSTQTSIYLDGLPKGAYEVVYRNKTTSSGYLLMVQ